MRRLPRHVLPSTPQFRFFSVNACIRQSEAPSPITPQPKTPVTPFDTKFKNSHKALKDHPQAPTPTKGFGRWTRNAETGEVLSYEQRQEEKGKEYLYTEPDPNIPLPPLLIKPPGLTEAPVQGVGHGIDKRKWWQRELEIWFGRYRRPFDVQYQIARHRDLYLPESLKAYCRNSYYTEWSEKADRRKVRLSHGKLFMSPNALFKVDKARYAPNFVGETIASPSTRFESVTYAAEKKATVLGIFSTNMGYRMVRPYLEAVEEKFSSNADVGVVRVQFELNWAKRAILNYYIKDKVLRQRYNQQQQESYIFTKKFVNRDEGEATHITNTQVGYVLLLDSSSRIRWMATGMPWGVELDALTKGVAKLVGEQVEDLDEVYYDEDKKEVVLNSA